MIKKNESTVMTNEGNTTLPNEERTALLKQAAAPVSQIKVSMESSPVSMPMVQAINDQELTSIYALLAYVAHNQNVSQDLVQMILEAEFSVDHASKIRRNDYQRAIEFLVDLRVDEVKN